VATESSSGSPHWVDNADQLAREEVFGPVQAVIPFDGDDEAVAIAHDSNYGLAGSVRTADENGGLDWPAGCAPAPSGSTTTASTGAHRSAA
jgi:hypothetical protein